MPDRELYWIDSGPAIAGRIARALVPVISCRRDSQTIARPLADLRPSVRPDHYLGLRRDIFVVHHQTDLRIALASDRPDRPEPKGHAPTPAHSERSQHGGARDARHAG